MERNTLLNLLFAFISIIALILSIITYTKEDKQFSGKVSHNGEQVIITDWFDSDDGRKFLTDYFSNSNIKDSGNDILKDVIRNGKEYKLNTGNKFSIHGSVPKSEISTYVDSEHGRVTFQIYEKDNGLIPPNSNTFILS